MTKHDWYHLKHKLKQRKVVIRDRYVPIRYVSIFKISPSAPMTRMESKTYWAAQNFKKISDSCPLFHSDDATNMHFASVNNLLNFIAERQVEREWD